MMETLRPIAWPRDMSVSGGVLPVTAVQLIPFLIGAIANLKYPFFGVQVRDVCKSMEEKWLR